MSLSLSAETLRTPFRYEFRIARETTEAATTVLVEVADDRFPGVVGYGEGFPDPFYGETPGTVLAVLPLLVAAAEEFEPTVEGLAAGAERMNQAIGGNGAAKCAIDIALHDLVSRRLGIPVRELLGVTRLSPPTDYTVGIDEPSRVRDRARAAGRFPALKVKLGGPADLETLEAVRSVYDGPIRVDANTGWSPTDLERLLPDLVRLGVELIEQPFPARRLDWLKHLHEYSPIPIVADESCVTADDLEPLIGVVAGVNIKLAKCGGVGPAARMLRRAHDLGFRTFLGCMEETSLGIAAAASIAGLADWVDLDGNMILAADPFDGLELDENCRWVLQPGAGLGVWRRDGAMAVGEHP